MRYIWEQNKLHFSVNMDEETLWRYESVLPKVKKRISLGEGFTPLFPIAETVFVKNETVNPTGSFKDRGMSLAISMAKEQNVENICLPSAGNAGISAAAYCKDAGIDCHVFLPETIPVEYLKETKRYTKNITLKGNTIADAAKEMVDQIIETGSVARGWLGVSVQEITKDLADSFELGTPRGALIGSVIKESPAERAGFKNGDVILEFDGKKIIYSGDLPLIVGRIKPDTKVDALVFRDKKEKIIPVKVGQLEELDPNQPVLAEKTKKRNKLEIVVGSIEEISSDDRERLNISSGVLVKEVYPGPASEAGIQIGDVITSIAQKEIKNTNDYRKIVSFLKKGSSVPIRIVRNGNGTFLTLKIEK